MKLIKRITCTALALLTMSVTALSVSAETFHETDDGKIYFETSDGVRATGLTIIDDDGYLFDEDGYARTGTYNIDGYVYHFSDDGKLYKGWMKTADGKYLYYNVNGVRVQNQFKLIEGNTCYFDSDGFLLTDGTYEINGTSYTFDDKGRLSAKTPYVPTPYDKELFGATLTELYTDIYKNNVFVPDVPLTIEGSESFDPELAWFAAANKLNILKIGDKYAYAVPVLYFEADDDNAYRFFNGNLTYSFASANKYSVYDDLYTETEFAELTEAEKKAIYNFYKDKFDKSFGGEVLPEKMAVPMSYSSLYYTDEKTPGVKMTKYETSKERMIKEYELDDLAIYNDKNVTLAVVRKDFYVAVLMNTCDQNYFNTNYSTVFGAADSMLTSFIYSITSSEEEAQ
jgi:hypothetical protein